MSIIIDNLNKEIQLLDKAMDKADKWYNDNKNNIHCSYIEAVELYRMGFDCRFINSKQK
jgi:hypothetical protein